MSSAVASTEPDPKPPADPTSGPSSRRQLLGWSLATTGLLLGSGTLRVLGSAPGRPEDLSVQPPFALETIPRSFDGWKFVEGSETHLDQSTTRITGSTDHVIRSYYDETTGTSLSVLVLYGPAEPVLPHTPQICYPSSGYRNVGEPVDRTIRINNQLSAVFRAGLFAKPGGRVVIRQSVYHSYRLDGVWSPAVTDRSLPRRWAGLFKVQIQRRVQDGERSDSDEPIESFLRQLLPVLEQRIAAASQATAAQPVVVGSNHP